MSFKVISYLALLWPLLRQSGTFCTILVEGIMQEEQFCEIILILNQWLGEMSLKIFPIWSSGDPCVRWSRTIYAILVEGIIGNLHVK